MGQIPGTLAIWFGYINDRPVFHGGTYICSSIGELWFFWGVKINTKQNPRDRRCPKTWDLKEDHTSVREKARLESLPISKSSACLAAAPIHALVLHLHPIEFRVCVKYIFGNKTYDFERKTPIALQVLWTYFVTMVSHVTECETPLHVTAEILKLRPNRNCLVNS